MKVYSTIFFCWKDNSLTLHDRTYTEAYKIAESFGYEKPKWWKKSTWNNTVHFVE